MSSSHGYSIGPTKGGGDGGGVEGGPAGGGGGGGPAGGGEGGPDGGPAGGGGFTGGPTGVSQFCKLAIKDLTSLLMSSTDGFASTGRLMVAITAAKRTMENFITVDTRYNMFWRKKIWYVIAW